MRLTVLDRGHRLPARLFFGFTELLSRVPMSDVPKTLLYRPDFFGAVFLDFTARTMRGPSFWTAGEREYIALRTSELLHCPFCAVTHTELVRLAGDPAPLRPELTAALTFVEDLIPPPDVPHHALMDALNVNLIFQVVNRLANVFEFELLPGQLESGTRSLHRFGYRFPRFLTGKGVGTLAELRRAVLQAPASTPPELRRAAAAGDAWGSYAATVRTASHRITDEDIARLKQDHTEDEIFEVTVAAAVGAALDHHDTGRENLAGKNLGG
jgi:AhpD family alkylhydroperoxidase